MLAIPTTGAVTVPGGVPIEVTLDVLQVAPSGIVAWTTGSRATVFCGVKYATWILASPLRPRIPAAPEGTPLRGAAGQGVPVGWTWFPPWT